jgi:quinoprotein glucose dehydrogenase
LLGKMEAGTLGPELNLELGEAIESSKSADLAARYKKINSTRSPDDVYASYAGSLMGGDPNRGRMIFYWHESAQCMRCHSYDDRGGTAGPRLNGVASRITREQILQALITPSARLAPGYGIVTLELKNGEKISGTLKRESKTEVVVASGNDPEKTISVSDIAKRTNAPSSMLDMKAILSKKEIRDVVAFLSTLKENN